jgi:hypothetical protein
MTASDLPMGRRGVPVIRHNVPQRNKNFTGREDILGHLRDPSASKVTAVVPSDPLPRALQGLGGVGKTAVAIEYVHRYQADYELIWWIAADQIPLVLASLAGMAERLGLPAATATGIEGAAAAVLDALRLGEPYSRWLLIFDNADQPEDLVDLIPFGPGDVLITSRNHRWQSKVDTVPVDVFDRAESAEFLTKRVPKGLTEPEADLLAEKLGDLPLALEQAGALQAETGMAVSEYLRLLDESVTKILAEGKSPDYPQSMTAAWNLSVAALQRQVPQALELLRCCAFFGPEAIPRDLFRPSSLLAGTRISELIDDPILLARAIRELGRFALIKIDGRTIVVHRLIQALLRDELNLGEQARYRHEVHLILAASAVRSPEDSALWPRYRELIGHVAAPTPELASCQDGMVRAFALNVIRYLYVSNDLPLCRSFAERFIAEWSKVSGPDDRAILDARRHLGNALRELGQYSAAYEVTDVTLISARRVLGERDDVTLALRNSFGGDLRARGDFVAARRIDEESLGIHQELSGPNDPQTMRVMNSLALDLGLNSEYEAARKLHQQVYLNLMQGGQAEEASPTSLLASWSGLARAVRLCGEYIEARDVGDDAYDFGRERLGASHYWTLRTAKDVSIALRRIASDYGRAIEVAQEVLDSCTRIFGDGHPDTMAAVICLTNIQRTIGQKGEALALAENTIARYPDVYGTEHPYNYGCIGNLALMRRVTGDPGAALELNERALAGLDERLTRDHDYSLTVATNLASDLAALGEADRARRLGEGTLRRLRELLGPNHPLTLGCAANLVLDMQAAGVTDAAEQLSADTMARYGETLGPQHPDVRGAAVGQRLDFDFDPPPI